MRCFVVAVLTVGLCACKEEPLADRSVSAKAIPAAPGQAPPAESPKTPTPVAAAGGSSSWVTLEKLNAKIEMPSGAKAEDNSVDSPSYSVSPEDFSFTVMVGVLSYAPDYQSTVEQTSKFTNGFKGFSRNEKTKDGWILEFEGEDMLDKSPVFGVTVRKKMGKLNVDCSRNEKTKQARDAVTKACLSLTASK